ncbi:MAG: hypothetical protein HY040_03145 [Planctomycetes bacterium]|nr:hypothetical protein [Planctomycetota bacterium]
MSTWSVNRWLVFALMIGFCGLFLETRYSHMRLVMVRREIMGWIPIYYSAFMGAACFLALVFWGRRMRRFLFWACMAAMGIGYLGYSFHSNNDPVKTMQRVVAGVYTSAPRVQPVPPEVAPLAFSILGLFGVFACGERLQAYQQMNGESNQRQS